MVLVAPPNAGSPLATKFAGTLGNWCRPISQLSEISESYVNRLGSGHGLEIGVIAGMYDRVVPVANTHLDGERAHIVVKATHNSLLASRRVVALAVTYLSNGHFVL